jgi:hypothetical protein
MFCCCSGTGCISISLVVSGLKAMMPALLTRVVEMAEFGGDGASGVEADALLAP